MPPLVSCAATGEDRTNPVSGVCHGGISYIALCTCPARYPCVSPAPGLERFLRPQFLRPRETAPNRAFFVLGMKEPESKSIDPVKKSAALPSLEDALKSEKAGTLVMSARMAHRKGNRQQARELLQQAFALAPSDAGALELLGDLFLEEGEQEKAIAIFERGRKYHPRHAAFEEKIGLARIDLAEMERDKIMRQQFLEHGDLGSWQDRKPGTSAMLSLVLPGAGQFYNEQYERGAVLLGSAFLLFLAWSWPLNAAARTTTAMGGSGSGSQGISLGFSNLDSLTKGFIVLTFLAWIAITIYAAIDAANIATRAAEDRKRSIGIWT